MNFDCNSEAENSKPESGCLVLLLTFILWKNLKPKLIIPGVFWLQKMRFSLNVFNPNNHLFGYFRMMSTSELVQLSEISRFFFNSWRRMMKMFLFGVCKFDLVTEKPASMIKFSRSSSLCQIPWDKRHFLRCRSMQNEPDWTIFWINR